MQTSSVKLTVLDFMMTFKKITALFVCQLLVTGLFAQQASNVNLIKAGDGWAQNTVNTVVYRKNSLVTYRDTQFIAYYNADKRVVLGKRKLGANTWRLQVTPYSGDVTDAHKSISIITDGDGFLHVTWGHHASVLNYARSIRPGSLELSDKMPMTGKKEQKVTYPEFYKLPNGDLLFLYRDGSSGNGDLMLDRYDVKTKHWAQLQNGLINGEGHRNAYWQMALDNAGTIHLSWVWRESPDVASNHDMCYARSKDGGKTWERSNGVRYDLPITIATAEVAWAIPQKSSLINQTSISVNDAGEPYIATYWKDDKDVIQYRLIYHGEQRWNMVQVSNRKTPFTLGGAGTKKVPLSRPQVMVSGFGVNTKVLMVFRDAERGNKPSVALTTDAVHGKWQIFDLDKKALDSWEPSYDTELWKNKGILNLFIQETGQGDGEKLVDMPPTPVYVLEWHPQ